MTAAAAAAAAGRDACLTLAIQGRRHQVLVSTNGTGIWCWHCCHPFEGLAVPLPMDHNAKTDVWTTRGAFCSFACAKAYNSDVGYSYRSGMRAMLLAVLKKRVTGKLTRTTPAPPRNSLRVFGGTLSIDEFRAKIGEQVVVQELPPRMVPLHTIVDERRVEEFRKSTLPKPDMKESVTFAETTQSNEMLRLKRPKPRASSTNVLARTMGLHIS
jgi:hypothetical protein